MSEYDTDSVDWTKVARSLRDANNSLRAAEQEIASGIDGFEPITDDEVSALMQADLPHEIDELVKGVTNSSSYLRNGTMNYIP